jgi:hypothetical protein
LCPCGHTRLLLEERLAEIDRERDVLEHLRAQIAAILDAAPDASAQSCAVELITADRRSAS